MQKSGEKKYLLTNTSIEDQFEARLAEEKHLGWMIRKRVEKYGAVKTAVRHKLYGSWEAFSWQQFGEMIADCACSLLHLGVQEGELVGIFSPNCVYWAVADFACFYIRAASVPVYATNSAAELKYIVDHAEIRVLFVCNEEQYNKALSIKDTCPSLDYIIVFDRRVKIQAEDNIMYFDDFLKLGRKMSYQEEMEKRLHKAGPDDLATIIYTSGTTGTPKGVMLTHRNWFATFLQNHIDFTGVAPGYRIPITEDAVNLAFLPLSHIFERAWTYNIFCGGGQVDYCHDTKALEEFLRESRPHYMCSVPRLWEKIHAKVLHDVNNAAPLKKKLFFWSIETGKKYHYRLKEGKIPFTLKLKYRLADKIVLHKIREVFGGRCRVYNVGGAPFSAEIGEFFFAAGVYLFQGYGLTECFPICVSTPERNRFGTCGPVVPLIDIRISEEGEIQVKGPAMTPGYYKDPEKTKEIFTADGWLKTGDVGHLNEEGFVVITDRIKDLFKTSGGKYIAPQHIETLLVADYYIEQAVAIGDNRNFVSALIVPAFEALKEYAAQNNIPFKTNEDLVKHPRIIEFYRQRIDELTADLGQVEKIKRFTLMPHEFTQETGELTPTLKVKRKVINEKYKDIIDAMYRDINDNL
ncbi:long-chain acyl-CoA synthetase [Thermosyntropha lipolytica DSM 11003]|uniref:Acyl-CoA synthetase n=1 Tax=Thermosyntropha lipolytica DSM 11003 TaxID=1123382 RepID=A0A1M5LQC5_9FIRM|nr:long-chain fatty acid--CoA ligase [Thermosyntropha lipolytica]SHG66543.1 long-chain acyl-CoA synthetase [Thermosyntropha lipolytica DSM 11003]